MVKDHSDSEKGNPLPPHRLLFPINIKGSPTDRIAHTMAFVTPVVEHWLEREIAVLLRVKIKFSTMVQNLGFIPLCLITQLIPKSVSDTRSMWD